jgi:hypothetical protein
MTDTAQLYKWDDMALEKVTDGISRKYVAGDREMIAQIYLTRGAIAPPPTRIPSWMNLNFGVVTPETELA